MWLQLISNTLGRLPYVGGRLHKFELSFLDAVKSQLQLEASELLEKQILLVNRVSRILNGRNVSLYCNKNGMLGFPLETLFLNQTDELLLAKILLGRGIDNQKLGAKIWTVSGHIFEIQYSRPPKDFFGVYSLASIQLSTVECELVDDPQIFRSQKYKTKPLELGALEKAIVLLKRTSISNLAAPFNRSSAMHYFEGLKTVLPKDFIQLLKITNGCLVDDWKIFGAPNLRQVSSASGDILLLAEQKNVGALAVLEGSKSGKLLFVDYIDDTQEVIQGDFVSAMLSVEKLHR